MLIPFILIIPQTGFLQNDIFFAVRSTFRRCFMKPQLSQAKKGIIVVNHSKVFEAMGTALEKVGCRVVEEFDAVSEVDLVVMDSFYLKAGMAEFIKKQDESILTLLVLHKHECGRFLEHLVGDLDDAMVVAPDQSPDDLVCSAVNWFKKGGEFSANKTFNPSRAVSQSERFRRF